MGRHGITAETITLGISWFDAGRTSTACGSVGADCGGAAFSQRNAAEKMISYINANGGIAGRKVVPVFDEFDITVVFNAERQRREEQRQCTKFTEDAKVFAILATLVAEGVYLRCAATADTPVVPWGVANEGVDEQGFAEIGKWYYRPPWLGVEAAARTLVARLVARNFFSPDARVGIMVFDRPAFRRGVKNALRPALQEAGVEVVHEIAYPEQTASPWDSYVLQFQQQRVSHVLFICGTGMYMPPMMFTRAADNQQFRPLYGTDTTCGPLNGLNSNLPAEQRKRFHGIGWYPPSDTYEYRDSPERINSGHELCRKIERDAGMPPDTITNNYCDPLLFLKAALDAAPALNSAGLAAGAASLGDRYVSPLTWKTRFGPGRHSGAAVVRDIAYSPATDRMEYTGGLQPVVER